jgi:hypothetical protein
MIVGCRQKADRRASATELSQIRGPFQEAQEVAASLVNLLRGTELHRDAGEKLSERIMNLAGQLISLLEDGGLPGGLG